MYEEVPIKSGLSEVLVDLLTTLRGGDVPVWMTPSHPVGQFTDCPVDEITGRESAVEFLQKWSQVADGRGEHRTIGFRIAPDGNANGIIGDGDVAPPPTSVQAACEEYDSSDSVDFDGFYIHVSIGRWGDVSDAKLIARHRGF